MAGRQALALLVGVRILLSQPLTLITGIADVKLSSRLSLPLVVHIDDSSLMYGQAEGGTE